MADYLPEVRRQLGPRIQASGMVCPKCQGGASRDRSLSAGKDGLRLWARCWRAKCGWFAAWDGTARVGLGYQHPAGVGRHRQVTLQDTLPVGPPVQSVLEGRYGLQEATWRHFGLRQYQGSRGVYVPIYGPSGASVGWVLRWVDGTKPKVRTYPGPGLAPGAPMVAWFTAELGGLVVCVEDVFSAMRLWERGITAVALLGVNLNPAKVAQLRAYGDTLVIALDADASAHAISQALKYRLAYRRLAIDIKDMTEDQLTTWTTCLPSSPRVSNPAKPATSSPAP